MTLQSAASTIRLAPRVGHLFEEKEEGLGIYKACWIAGLQLNGLRCLISRTLFSRCRDTQT